MAKLTYAQKFSFCETVAEFLQEHQERLNQAGLDVEKILKTLLDENKKALEADARQESLKAELVEATEKAVAALDKAYRRASSSIDAMVGVLGKKDPLSKRLRQLRDQMAKEALRGKKRKQQGT